jgi:hypothetical protein
MTKPNFFIVGAPKCGTTALLTYLLEHPEIYAPGTWEFNYLNDDLTWLGDPPVTSDEEYLAHFQDAGDYERIGEKSAFYLYSERAPHRIHDLNPSAKIICMFRDPIDVMWSLYRYHVQAFREDILSFEEALAAEERRKQGQCIPEHVNFVEDLYYREVVRFAEQLERYLEVFGWSNVHVILFGDFVEDTDEVYRDTLRFLDVAPASLSGYEPHNESQKINALGVRRFLKKYSGIKSAIQAVFPPRARQAARRLLGKATGGEPGGVAEMDDQLRAELNKELAPEAKRLGRLINRDLSHWCGENRAAANQEA